MGLQTTTHETRNLISLRMWTMSLVHSVALLEPPAMLAAQQTLTLPFRGSSLKGMNTGQQESKISLKG